MDSSRKVHPDFQYFLDFKEQNIVDLFNDLRNLTLDIYPESNELLYHTHALTSLFSISEKMSDAFCMISIYSNHLNLGFNKGTLIKDPHKLLIGTGKLIRHIPINNKSDYRNDKINDLIKSSIDFAIKDMDKPTKSTGATISKIKK